MIQLTVNEQPLTFEGDPHMPLLWFLRDEAGLTGTKFGCGIAMCGACTVHLDGVPVRSCMTPVSAAVGKKSPPSKPWAPRRKARRCRKPGLIWTWCSAATASPARS